MWLQIRIPPVYFDADPDPTFHFDADADPAPRQRESATTGQKLPALNFEPLRLHY